MEAPASPATCIASNIVTLVVAETDRLGELARAAIGKLSEAKKLRSERAVKAESKRFAAAVAAKPTCLDVWVLPVVGFTPMENSVYDFEPIVVHEGKLQRVSGTYLMVAGDYWVGTLDEVKARRKDIVAELARQIAEEFCFGEALFGLIDEADVEGKLLGSSVDPKTGVVEFDGDPDHEIAKRLPTWVKIRGLTVGTDYDRRP